MTIRTNFDQKNRFHWFYSRWDANCTSIFLKQLISHIFERERESLTSLYRQKGLLFYHQTLLIKFLYMYHFHLSWKRIKDMIIHRIHKYSITGKVLNSFSVFHDLHSTMKRRKSIPWKLGYFILFYYCFHTVVLTWNKKKISTK